MLPIALVVAGAALFVATLAVARLTAKRTPEPDVSDPWARFAPLEDVERGRPRVWPTAAALLAVVLVASGLLLSSPSGDGVRVERASAHTPRPYLIEVALAATASPTLEASPTPSPTPDTTPSPSPGTRRSTPRPGTAGDGGRPEPTRPPTPAPTPTPTPKPGPSVSANTSCFNGSLQIGYSATARSGTSLGTLRVSLDGSVVAQPSVSGRTSYSGNYQTSGSPGAHTFQVTATGSDGGVTHRHYPVTC